MDGYHSPQVEAAVRLNTNECPTPPPAAWVEALAQALADVAWNRYPDREATALREAVAGHHGVPATRVFAANGSNEVLQSLCLAYGGAGRTLVTFEPTYALHSHIARVTGGTVVEGGRTEGFGLDLDAVEALLAAGPSVVFLCSPNNPTGVVEPRDTVERIVERCRATGTLVVVDEAYGQFSDWTALDLVDDDRPLVVCRTFSKTWAMAAARLGYLVGPEWVVAELEKVVLPYHLDAVTQLGGRLALAQSELMAARVAEIVAERERMSAALATMAVEVVPSGANFVLFRVGDGDADRVWEGLLDRGVLVRNCSGWPRLSGHLRVSVGTAAETDAFLHALTEVLE